MKVHSGFDLGIPTAMRATKNVQSVVMPNRLSIND